jgi:hypothetical protein
LPIAFRDDRVNGLEPGPPPTVGQCWSVIKGHYDWPRQHRLISTCRIVQIIVPGITNAGNEPSFPSPCSPHVCTSICLSNLRLPFMHVCKTVKPSHLIGQSGLQFGPYPDRAETTILKSRRKPVGIVLRFPIKLENCGSPSALRNSCYSAAVISSLLRTNSETTRSPTLYRFRTNDVVSWTPEQRM